jgi:hypothetical protein
MAESRLELPLDLSIIVSAWLIPVFRAFVVNA